VQPVRPGRAEVAEPSMTLSFQGAGTPKGAEPARGGGSEGQPTSTVPLLFVTAGLGTRGGGIAAAGRLLLSATVAWAADRGLRVHVLTLGDASDVPPGLTGEAFAGNQARLAAAVWRWQLRGARLQVYDFLGVARIQGVLPRRLRARYLVYLYGIECWRPLGVSRARALHGAAVRLACSSYTVRRMRASNPQSPEITPLALAIAGEPPTGHADGGLLDSVGSGFLLIVGRMASGERYKGHDELFEALQRLAPAMPDLRLVVTGDGDDRLRLEARAAELGIADRVRFTGFVDEATLAALYDRCSALVMPSSGEGFGLVYLEAMRAGRPCIARAGLLVEPGVDSLTSALALLLLDDAARESMGAAGRRRFDDEFRVETFTERLRPFLDEMANGARPASQRTGPS
jgi:phosphatidylinositol alpha-1,6-mannosyltransferase